MQAVVPSAVSAAEPAAIKRRRINSRVLLFFIDDRMFDGKCVMYDVRWMMSDVGRKEERGGSDRMSLIAVMWIM